MAFSPVKRKVFRVAICQNTDISKQKRVPPHYTCHKFKREDSPPKILILIMSFVLTNKKYQSI